MDKPLKAMHMSTEEKVLQNGREYSGTSLAKSHQKFIL
jgi:hypothetical protein